MFVCLQDLSATKPQQRGRAAPAPLLFIGLFIRRTDADSVSVSVCSSADGFRSTSECAAPCVLISLMNEYARSLCMFVFMRAAAQGHSVMAFLKLQRINSSNFIYRAFFSWSNAISETWRALIEDKSMKQFNPGEPMESSLTFLCIFSTFSYLFPFGCSLELLPNMNKKKEAN